MPDCNTPASITPKTPNDHQVLASIGTVGDAYDNALAESFVDSFKTELMSDRVWRTRGQLELAVVEYIGWFKTSQLHSSLGYLTPDEVEGEALDLRIDPGPARTVPNRSERAMMAAGLSDE
jgi:putative transposase